MLKIKYFNFIYFFFTSLIVKKLGIKMGNCCKNRKDQNEGEKKIQAKMFKQVDYLNI